MINELFQSIDEKDATRFGEFLADDCTFRFANLDEVVGKENVVDYVGRFFDSIKAIRHEIGDVWTVDGAVVCHGTVNYTRHDGSPLSVPFANVLKLSGTAIKDYLIYVDASKLYVY